VANAVERAYEALLEGILSGAHPPGSRLREEELAAAIGLSRTPVREALQRLHAEGLVDEFPNRGAVVADLDADLDDMYELRSLLEGYGARRAATRATAEQLYELDDLCTKMEDYGRRTGRRRLDVISQLNTRFHRELHAAGRNARLMPLISGLMLLPLVRHTFHHYSEEELQRSLAQHRELVEAIRARDPVWAEAVMHAHVSAGRNSLRRQQSAASGTA
jgi:DNA-binding GntR family transcriptional regulator